MLTSVVGNIFDSDAEAIVNTVNLEGVMGKGLAQQFKNRYPKNFRAYIKACKNKEIDIGRVFVFTENSKIIVNFPTKRSWRYRSELSYIIEGLQDLVRIVQEQKIASIAIPRLGCGLGGLNWIDVLPEIEKAFSVCPQCTVYVYSEKSPK